MSTKIEYYEKLESHGNYIFETQNNYTFERGDAFLKI